MGIRRMTRGLAVTAGLVGIAVLVAACGGGSSKAHSSASTTPVVSPAVSATPTAVASAAGSAAPGGRNGAAFAAYTACLAQHGVKVPTFAAGARPSGGFSRPAGGFSRAPGASRGPGGGFGGFGSPNPSTSAARAACASLLPAGAFGPGTRTISATTFAAFKSCMSDNGVTITSTDPQTAIRGLDRTDAKTAAALKICQPILGQGAGAAGSGAPVPSATPAASS
jgi:hypothetical protein